MHASKNKIFHFICFIPKDFNLESSKNVTFVEVNRMGWLHRFLLAAYNLKNILTGINSRVVGEIC